MSPFSIADLRVVVYIALPFISQCGDLLLWQRRRTSSSRTMSRLPLLRDETLPLRAVLVTTSTGSLLQPKRQY
jgi:hypothetical protein